jgi:hypothetical protein
MSGEPSTPIEPAPPPGGPPGWPDADERCNGPGWSDWCYTPEQHAIPPVWDGEVDTIDWDRHKGSREGWWRVVCAWVDGVKRPTLNTACDCLWWFHLRLTMREAAEAMQTAYTRELIKPLDGQVGHVSDRPDVLWTLTPEGRQYTRLPRGAGEADFIARLLPEGKRALKVGGAITAFFTSTLVAALVSGLLLDKLTTADKLLGAELGGIAALVAWMWLTAVASMRDERTLTSMVKSWPRLDAYRPARAEFETNRVRVPFPWLVACLSTIAGVLGGAWLLYDADHLTGDQLRSVATVALLISVALVAAARGFRRHAVLQEEAWIDERQRRANPPDAPYGVRR